MKKGFIDYLKSIGITDALIPNIKYLFTTMTLLVQEEIQDIIVSEYVQEDGTRYYETFRGFTNNFCVAAARFLQEEYFIVWNLKKFFTSDVTRVNFEVENYDFKSAIPSSRLTVYCVGPEQDNPLVIKTSGQNCQHFFNNIFKKHIHPRITT